jgi:hypothetical protein
VCGRLGKIRAENKYEIEEQKIDWKRNDKSVRNEQ